MLVALLLMLLTSRCALVEGFDTTIMVAISSYRDVECMATVKDAFAKADKPGRIYAGVCQQNKESGEDCTAPGVDPSHVRTISMPHTEARGPTYARSLCSTLYQGEDYVLQIDSHTRFVQGWDTKLIQMIERCPSAKPVLTHYPHSYDVDEQTLRTQVPVMCRSKWNGDGIPTFEAVMKPLAEAGMRQVPFLAGGMLFGPGRMFQEVPLDPGLSFVFQGEEVLLSARLFTHGWDLYTPAENVVLHHYVRKDGPRFWDDLKGYQDQQVLGVKRVRQLLGLDQPDLSGQDPYGMGPVRTLQDWWAFSRLNPQDRSSDSQIFFCR